jgi:hypothetical protein
MGVSSYVYDINLICKSPKGDSERLKASNIKRL